MSALTEWLKALDSAWRAGISQYRRMRGIERARRRLNFNHEEF